MAENAQVRGPESRTAEPLPLEKDSSLCHVQSFSDR